MTTLEIIGIVIGAVGTVLGGVYFIVKQATNSGKRQQRFDTLEGVVNGLPCTEHNNKLGDTATSLAEIKAKIDTMLRFIDPAHKTAPIYTESHSPVVLTENGKKVAADFKLFDDIETNWNPIHDAISASGATIAYDIDRFCFEKALVSPEMFLTPEAIERLKTFAFSEGLSIQAFSGIIAVIVRDKYFKELGIDGNDVDAHSSKQE